MNLTTFGIDLAKTSFSLVGMEAGSGAYYWTTEFTKLDYKASIIASKFIAPF